MKTIAAGEFKAKCLAVMDDVARTGETVLVTKRGKPMVRVSALMETTERKTNVDSIFNALRGMVTIVGEADDLINPIIPEEDWDCLQRDSPLFPPE